MTQPGFPPDNPFPASLREPRPGAGPDFPASSGGREQGKFRESLRRHLTAIAVVNDDGTVIGKTAEQRADEQLLYLRAIVLGLSYVTEEDLLSQV